MTFLEKKILKIELFSKCVKCFDSSNCGTQLQAVCTHFYSDQESMSVPPPHHRQYFTFFKEKNHTLRQCVVPHLLTYIALITKEVE